MSTTINPYLSFNGNCADAMRFYEKALGANVTMMMTFGESPMCDQTPPEARDLVMHAAIALGDEVIMASDCPPGMPFDGMKGMSVTLNYDDENEARKVYDALVDDAQHVTMPLQPTFWAKQFGMFTDRFGTPWIVNGGPLTAS